MKRQTLYSRHFKKLVWIGFSGVLLLPESLFSLPFHHQAERWVATSPQVTELLYQLGWGENLVGAPAGSQHPEEAKKLSSIGNFLSPNLEKILRLSPTKVWADNSQLKI